MSLADEVRATLAEDVAGHALEPPDYERPVDRGDRPGGPSALSRFLNVAGPFLVFGLFVGFWYFMAYVGITEILDKPDFFVPPPHEVVRQSFLTWDNLQPMLEALWLTTRVAMTGLALAIVVGMGLAVVMSQAKWIERAVYPYAVALQAIPILAFVPLIGLLFGYNFGSRVFVCFLIALFPIIANTLFGLLSADRSQHELFTLHGAGRATRLRKLMVPAALPAIFAGLRISAGLSVIGAIVGDFFFRQGEKGIGILIDQYNQRLNYPLMYGAVILAALLGIVVFWIFGLVSRKAVGHWYEETGKPQ